MYCPYCFASLENRAMICENPTCALFEQSASARKPRLRTRLPDRVRIRGGSVFAGQVIRCDSCGNPCAAVCTECGRKLPSAWVRYPDKRILFLGVNGVGKSTLLASTKLRLSQRTDVGMTPLDVEETAERFYLQYAKPLLEENDRVPHTKNEIPVPFLWGMSTSAGGRRAQTVALALYDVPGEMLSCYASAAPIRPLLSRADGVVLVLNPVSLPTLHRRCGAPEEIPLAADGWERAERILDTLLERGEIGRQSKLAISVVFTHLDIWFSAVSDYTAGEALTDATLRRLAAEWQGEAFLNRLREFQHHRLFATGLYQGDMFRALDGVEAPMRFLLRRFGMNFQ